MALTLSGFFTRRPCGRRFNGRDRNAIKKGAALLPAGMDPATEDVLQNVISVGPNKKYLAGDSPCP